jgi:hypothetical protein
MCVCVCVCVCVYIYIGACVGQCRKARGLALAHRCAGVLCDLASISRYLAVSRVVFSVYVIHKYVVINRYIYFIGILSHMSCGIIYL